MNKDKNNRDWTGSRASAFYTIGANGFGTEDREINDYYATDPIAVKYLLELEQFSENIWEPACGENFITNVLKEHGHKVRTSDIIDRLHDGSIEIIDFLKSNETFDGDIITNPPYKYAKDFVEKAMESITDGHKVAMFLKLTFLESKSRRDMFKKYPPKYLYVSSSRLACAKNGKLDKNGRCLGSAIAYGWFVWEKGFTGEPRIRWFN